MKSLFSGMTEGVHQFTRMDFQRSIRANVFSPLVLPAFAYCLLRWTAPKLDTRRKEMTFFLIFIVLSVIVNVLN